MASLFQRIDTARSVLHAHPAAAQLLLTDAGTQIKTAIANRRRLVYSLRPPALDELGLVAVIEEECRRLGSDTLTIDVRVSTLPVLPAAVDVAAYRIAVEALTNVVRHANARQAVVTLEVDGDRLLLDVSDDGTGIALNAPTGVGLASMFERAQEIGGGLTIVSNHPRRPMVRARLPLLLGGTYRSEASA